MPETKPAEARLISPETERALKGLAEAGIKAVTLLRGIFERAKEKLERRDIEKLEKEIAELEEKKKRELELAGLRAEKERLEKELAELKKVA
jgi:hypothetical protein